MSTDPPISYWCSEYPREHQSGDRFAIPSGVIINATQYLPNAPYLNSSGLIFNTFQAEFWNNWFGFTVARP